MVFDLAPLVHQMEPALLLRLIGLAHIALGNEEEWQRLFNLSDSKAAAQAALALGARCVYLKRGPAGSIRFEADGSTIEQPAVPSQPISTAGAGDAYTAAILAGLAAGRSHHWGQTLAAHCGALHTEHRPDSENIASLQRILALE
jgi:sugar/nucleoside kinase (ribokinase family)